MPEAGDPPVQLEDVSVRYRLARLRRPSIKQYALHWAGGALTHESFWALRNVSLEVKKGEGLGIVGRNGAGKSTLLKVLSGLLEPTTGTARVVGRLSAILEAGAAFDPELSGVENVYLAALLMGCSRREIEARLDEIVSFSGLGDFVHSPLRNYSSGMQARLSFAVSVAWPLDVLLIDEVLAVGDAAFIHRCGEKLAELRASGLTIIVVSHQPSTVLEVCERCIWLEDGRVVADGAASEVLKSYEVCASRPDLSLSTDRPAPRG